VQSLTQHAAKKPPAWLAGLERRPFAAGEEVRGSGEGQRLEEEEFGRRRAGGEGQ